LPGQRVGCQVQHLAAVKGTVRATCGAVAALPSFQIAEARTKIESLLAAKEEILTLNYVLVESMALIHHRLGLSPALKLAQDSSCFRLKWVTEVLHADAIRRLERGSGSGQWCAHPARDPVTT
jgi:hypothetical protein